MRRRAVFLDRDGTINREVGYLRDPTQLELLPGAAKAIKLLNENGFLTLIITNQSGVGRGYFTEETLHRIHEKLQNLLAKEGAFIDAIYYCPHAPDANCECRKPETGLLRQAVIDLGVDLKHSYVVGDKWSDLEIGHRIGCKTVLILTGYGRQNLAKCRGRKIDYVASDLLSAVYWIINERNPV